MSLGRMNLQRFVDIRQEDIKLFIVQYIIIQSRLRSAQREIRQSWVALRRELNSSICLQLYMDKLLKIEERNINVINFSYPVNVIFLLWGLQVSKTNMVKPTTNIYIHIFSTSYRLCVIRIKQFDFICIKPNIVLVHLDKNNKGA